MLKYGWFRVKSSGAVVRACEFKGRVYLNETPQDEIGYPVSAFEFIGSKGNRNNEKSN